VHVTTTTETTWVLSDDVVERCGSRAAAYDRDNRFFAEDFEELRDAGYLTMAVPTELGGRGLDLAQVCAEERRLAARAPATALATNMHIYWTGVAADLMRNGDDSARWILEEAAAGEVFAAGHGEAGNDLPLLMGVAQAERADGGYRFTGHKIFGSLTPVWTRLGIHAIDASDVEHPMIVHAFLPRDAAGWSMVETWDTIGMRATRSDDTLLDGAFVPDRYIARVVPAGFAGADLFVLAIFAWAECTFGSIYLGLADRAIDLAVGSATSRVSVALEGRTMAWNPMVQSIVADMVIDRDRASALVERTAADWSGGVDHGGLWPSKLVTAKYAAAQASKAVVDGALDVVGGSGLFARNELERLLRDVRSAGIHPANNALVHELVGKTHLGLLGVEPRFAG
jgi:alkylation response protein AidB-like acyl-CoA dehydrogenase